MGKRQSMGAVFRRENKKKRYTQKLSKKTINEIKNRGKSESKPRTSFSTPGSRVGTTVHNESRDRVKAVLKKALTSNKPVSKAHLNQSLGGRAGSETQRLKLKSYDTYKSNKGLSASESARKSEFKRATSYQGMRLGETRKDLASGFYSNKKSETERTKEKANVRKNIEKGYNKKAENSTASFLAGLTKSNKTIETASKALLDKKVDTSKVTKKGAYKAGDTVQELASYFIAPTEAAAGKIGAKMVERGASKVLQNSVKNLSRKEAKAMLKKAAGGEIKNIGGKGIAKAATKKANAKAIEAATEGIKDKAVKEAVTKAGKEVVGSRVKRQIARRGGDVAANAALNAKYAVDRATDSKGKTNWKEAAKDFAVNTAFDVGLGGSIDSATGKVRKVKAAKADRIAKYERKIKGGFERANAKKAVEKETPTGFRKVGSNPVKGKSVASADTLNKGGVIKRQFDNIDKLEAAGKLNRKQAKAERKALAKATERTTGRTGFAYRGKNGVEFGNATNKGIERIDNSTFGRKLGIDKRFTGKAERFKKLTEEEKLARRDAKAVREHEYQVRQEAKERALADKAMEQEGKRPITSDDLDKLEESRAEADNARYGRPEKEKVADKVKAEQAKPKTKTAEKRQRKAVEDLHKEYVFDGERSQKEIDEALKEFAKTGDREQLREVIREHAPDAVVEKLDDISGTDVDAVLDTRRRMRRGFYNEKDKTGGMFNPYGGKGIANTHFTRNESFIEYGTKFYNKGGKRKRAYIDDDYDELQQLYGKGAFPDENITTLDRLMQMKKVADTQFGSLTRTARDAGMSREQIEKLADDLTDQYIEAAAKAEPKAGKGIKGTKRSRIAETDNVVDETPDYAELHPEAEKVRETKDAAQGTETTLSSEKTEQSGKVSAKEEKGVKSSDISATKEAMAHVSRKPKPTKNAEINKKLVEARRKLVDSMYFLENETKKWAKVTGDPKYADAMRGEINNVRQASTMAAHSFGEEQIDFNHQKVGESGSDILKDINSRGDLEDVQAYLYYLNHADRLDAVKDKELEKLIEDYKTMENRIEFGDIPELEGKAELEGIKAKMDKLNDGTFGLNGEQNNKRLFDNLSAEDARAKAREIAEAKPSVIDDADRIVQYFRNDLRSQVQAGLVSPDTARHYMQTYPNYVPAHRADFGAGLDVKSTISPNPEALRAKGSGRDILPIDDQMRMSTNYTFVQGANNKLKQMIADKVGVKKDTLEMLQQEMHQTADFNPLTLSDVDSLDIATFFDPEKATIKYFDEGKLKTVDLSGVDGGAEIVKDLIDQTKTGVSSPLGRSVLNFFGKLNRGFKALITSYSLPFMVKNFFRDVPEGALQSESTRGYLKNLLGFDNSLRSIISNDDYYKAFCRTGGAHAQFIDPVKLFNDKHWGPLKLIDKVERLNEITEQIPRMAEFKNALQRMGVTPKTATANQLRQAAQAAADVTVNFGRSGSLGRIVNSSFIPFFNPAIQGGDKIIRVIARDKNAGALLKLATKAAMFGVAPAAVNDMLLSDNPHYADISDRDKMTNYIIPLSKDNPLSMILGGDGDMFLKIPKARALSVAGAIEQKFAGQLPDSSWGDLLAFGSDQVGPVGWSNNILMQLYNSEIWDNSKPGETWYGSDIESQYDRQDAQGRETKAHKRFDANTSSISVGLTNVLSKAGIDVSPKKLDYLIDSYTGIAGDVALSASRKAAKRGVIASAFTIDSTLQSNVQSRYYNKLKDPDTSDKDLKRMKEWGTRISTVTKAIKNLQDSDTKNKDQKVKDLTKLRNSLMKKALDGKSSKDPTGDVKTIAKSLGAKKTFDMIASDSDKKVLKKYGKADDKFLNSYVAVKSLTAGQKGKPSKAAQAVAIVSAGGGKKVAKAFGVTQKSGDDMASAYKRAKDYIKNGGSVEEFKRFQKAAKDVKGKGTDQYMNKAFALAKMGASNRAFALYDIKDTKVTKARNMAAVGITPKDVQAHRSKADTSGNNYLNKEEVQAYVSRLKGSKAKKSVIYDSLAFWRNNGNPYGSINASAKQAADKDFKAKYSGSKSSDEGKAGPVPLKRGYQTENGKKKPNGKTIGSIGEKVALPTRSYKEWKENAKTRTLPSMNAFGSRIGDKTKTVQREKDKPLVIHKVTKNKDGSTDIKFANGEVWHNPEKKEKKDNTKLGTSGSGGGGGRRGYRRGWRRYGRGGYGGRGGSGGGASTPSTPKLNLSPYATKSVPHRTIGIGKRSKSKAKEGLTKAQLKEIMKMAVKADNRKAKIRTSSANPYKITKS